MAGSASNVLPAPAGSLDPRGKARRPLGQGFPGLTSGSPAPRLCRSTVRHHQSRKTQHKLVCRQSKASPPRAAKPRAERHVFGSRSEGFLRLAKWLSQPRAPPHHPTAASTRSGLARWKPQAFPLPPTSTSNPQEATRELRATEDWRRPLTYGGDRAVRGNIWLRGQRGRSSIAPSTRNPQICSRKPRKI